MEGNNLITAFKGEARQKFILHGLRILLDALELCGTSRPVRSSLIPAQGLVECLLVYLKGWHSYLSTSSRLRLNLKIEPIAQDISEQAFKSCSTLVDRIHNLISLAQSEIKECGGDALTCDSFGVMLECSLHSTEFWESFSNHPRTRTVLALLTLESPSINIRKAAATSIKSVCGVLPSSVYLCTTISQYAVLTRKHRPSKVTRESFVLFFWNYFFDTIKKTLHMPQCAEHFYETALEIFRLRGNNGNEALPVTEYVSVWSNMLIDRDHEEVCIEKGESTVAV